MAIKKNNIIEKRNILNEIRCNNMYLQELRFFTIYLSKINARNPEETRLVRFPLSDFMAIMEFKNINISELKQTTNSLLCKVVNIPFEDGGYTAFQLFKKCIVRKDKNTDEWYIEIDAHDDALPLMFDFKRDYFTYELWNALRLTSSNQLRMYEILKQYQKKGERTIKLEELRDYLFIEKNEYIRFGNFKTKVLNVCQKALKENTDIYFEYELIKKARGKVSAIKFNIFKNTEYKDPLSIAEFIDSKNGSDEVEEADIEDEDTIEEGLQFFMEACNNEFNELEIQVLFNIISQIIPFKGKNQYQLDVYDYLKQKYDYLAMQASRHTIKNRFGYIKKIIEADIPD